MRILIIGRGGREDAISWKLAEEGHEVIAAPGNPGMAMRGAVAALDINNHKAVSDFVKAEGIEFTVVGGEAPLAAGIVNHFEHEGLPIFGPSIAAADIETSKRLCCNLLTLYGVPVPVTFVYQDFATMRNAIRNAEGVVLKKSGLANGKGVEVVRRKEDLPEALRRLEKLGEDTFLVQNLVEGPELSFFVLTDGEDFLFLGSAQDYKPLFPGGLNTGGMGGFSPHPVLTPRLRRVIEDRIVRKTINALADEGRFYRGVLYFQLMITWRGPVVIEINCRFGDPEAQLLMPLLDCELLPLLVATTKSGVLRQLKVKFKPKVSVGFVLASEGYPDNPKTGRAVMVSDKPDPCDPDVHVFHAGTKLVNGRLLTAGGRVFTVVGVDTEYERARSKARKAANQIEFEGKYYRSDIGDEAIAQQSKSLL